MPKVRRGIRNRVPPVTPLPPAFSPEMWFNPDRALDTSQVIDNRNAIKKTMGFEPIPPWVFTPTKPYGRVSRTSKQQGR